MSASETLRFVNRHHGGQLPSEVTRVQQFRVDTGLSQSTRTPKRKFSDDHERISLPPRSFPHSPTSSVAVLDEVGSQNDARARLIIVMVGLPARGKSYVTKKLCRYLNWLQHDTRIFNVGDRRRKLRRRHITLPLEGPHPVTVTQASDHFNDHSANFFDPENDEAKRLREKAAMETLDELLDYLIYDGGCVALFDATNSTIERRDLVMQKVRERGPELRVMFLESQCFDESVRIASKFATFTDSCLATRIKHASEAIGTRLQEPGSSFCS